MDSEESEPQIKADASREVDENEGSRKMRSICESMTGCLAVGPRWTNGPCALKEKVALEMLDAIIAIAALISNILPHALSHLC